MPRATEQQLLGMLEARRALGWITAASGWSKTEVTDFAAQHDLEFGADAHPRPRADRRALLATPTPEAPEVPVTSELLTAGAASTRSATRKLADRIHDLMVDLAARVKAEREQDAAATEVKRLEEQLAAARLKARGQQPAAAKPAQSGGSYMAKVRAWARENGHQVADRGVVSPTVCAAYEAAHKAGK